MSTAGYSGKPLARKLGIEAGDVVGAIGAPPHYPGLLDPLPAGTEVVLSAPSAPLVHAFVTSRAELAAMAERLVSLPAPGGSLWISWPKQASHPFSDPTEDGVREFPLPTGRVDVKIRAVDADWSGLKFLRRAR